MTFSTAPETGRQVLLIDLRDVPPSAIRRRALEMLHGADRAYGRVLIVDDVTALRDHNPVYEAILSSRSVESVICIAAGLPLGDRGDVVVRGTPVFASDKKDAALLWVGDGHGVNWRARMGETAMPPPPSTQPDAGLEELIGLLRIDDVFKEVLAAAVELPNGVASPGYRAVSGLLDQAFMRDAEARAVAGLVRPHADVALDLDKEPPPYRILFGRAAVPEAVAARRLVDDSPLGRSYGRAIAALDVLGDRLDAAAGPGALIRPRPTQEAVRAAAQDAARSLDGWRADVLDQFEQFGAVGPPDQITRDQLTQSGIDLAVDAAAINPAAIVDWLEGRAASGLDRGEPLGGVVQWMRDVADGTAPAGSAAAAEVGQSCPMQVLDQLMSRSRLRLVGADAQTHLAVFLGCLVPALAGGSAGLIAGGAVAAGWLAGVLFLLQGARSEARAPVLGIHAAVAAAGVAGGLQLGRLLGAPAAIAFAAVPAVGVLGWLLSRWWGRVISVWAGQLGEAAARTAAVDLRRLLGQVATLEWALADLRRFTSDAARAAANAFEECADQLVGMVSGPGTRPSVRLDDGTVPALRRVIAADVKDLVRAAVTPGWERLRGGVLDEVPGRTAERTGLLLEAYREHLDRRGPEEPPSFARPSSERERLSQAVWQQTPAAAALLRDASPNVVMRQLCSKEDLGVLRVGEGDASLLRFAPRAAQDVFTDIPDRSRVVWTSSGAIVGAIRLVPLRWGQVVLEWPTEQDPT